MTDDGADATDAFDLLEHELRVDVLRTLQAAERTGEGPLGYAAIMDRTDVRDSGKFNYHLQRLVGRFVRETDGGYALTYAGRTVASALVAGTFDDGVALGGHDAPGRCYACDAAALRVRYDDDHLALRLWCDGCGEEVAHVPFPPRTAADHDLPGLLDAFDAISREWARLFVAGVCPACRGPVAGELTTDAPTLRIGDARYRARFDCRRCWARVSLPAGFLALGHPVVVAAHWRAGVDLRARRFWTLPWTLDREYETPLSESPPSVDVSVPVDDQRLRLAVGTDLSVRVRE